MELRPPSPPPDLVNAAVRDRIGAPPPAAQPSSSSSAQATATQSTSSGHVYSREKALDQQRSASLQTALHSLDGIKSSSALKEHSATLHTNLTKMEQTTKEIFRQKVLKQDEISAVSRQLTALGKPQTPEAAQTKNALLQQLARLQYEFGELERQEAPRLAERQQLLDQLAITHLKLGPDSMEGAPDMVKKAVRNVVINAGDSPELQKDAHKFLDKMSGKEQKAFITDAAKDCLKDKRLPPPNSPVALSVIREMHSRALQSSLAQREFAAAFSTRDFQNYLPKGGAEKFIKDLAKDCLEAKRLPPRTQISPQVLQAMQKESKSGFIAAQLESYKSRVQDPFRQQGVPEFHINAEEAQKISNFVDAHMSEWLKDLKEGQHIRVTGDKEGVKDRSALPRTLDVFMENGEVKVMVLCKMKEGQATIGQGEFKLVRAAVDWSNGEMYVDAVLKQKSSANRQYEVTPEIEAEVLKEFSCYESVGGKPGISARPMGLHNYTVKNAQGAEITKTSFYQPYYPNGNLLSFIVKKQSAGELDFQTQVKIFRGVLSGVDTLKNNNILHRDLKEDNMYMDNEYNPKIADFGCADTIKDPTLGAPKLTETEYREMIDKGNAGSRSPEQWLIERYRRFGVEATPEILKFDAEINANRAKSRALVQSNPKAFDTPEYKALLKEHGELVAKRKGRIEELNKSWSQTIPMLWYSNCGKSETYSAGVTCVGMVLRQIVNTPEGKLNRFAARFSEVLENAAKEVTFTKEDPVNHQLKSKPFREFSSEYYARVQVALNDYVARAVSECNPPLTAEQMQLLELGMQLLTCDPNARTTTNQALSRLSDIEQRYAPAH